MMFMLVYLYDWKIWSIACRHHLDDFTSCCIIVMLKERGKITDVARELDFVHSVISRLWRALQRPRICSKRHRKSCLSAWHPKKVLPQVSRHPKKNCSQIFASRRTIHPKTFFVCAIVKSHCICLQCCFQHQNWIENNCACVHLSDGSIFSLFSDRKWKLIWLVMLII